MTPLTDAQCADFRSLPTEREVCVWTYDWESNWWTDCKNGFTFNDDGPKANGFKYCCYCSKPIVENIPADPDSAPLEGDALP
ncbi:hypothetical protein ACSFA8_20880 [Variovorax sp. RT4R15]|uniref:hypothetical protein n=1 Tax=Variovorax sp. RT4R15 TaxID=3443737 RepID=UPI003F480DB8